MRLQLSDEVVDNVLESIRNNVQITNHLLSRPLRRRHTLLDIALEADPVSYLSWPPHPPNLFSLLSFSHSSHRLTVYLADPISLFAHTQINAELQLVFLYHPEDQDYPWKYHDTRVLPLPPNAQTSLALALEALQLSPLDNTMDASYDDNPSAFWEGYQSSDSSPISHAKELPISSDLGEDSAERQYWDRYSGIQGSQLPLSIIFRPSMRIIWFHISRFCGLHCPFANP